MTKVVITGLGICSPLGEGITANWRNLTEPSPCLRRPSPKTGEGDPSPFLGEGGYAADEGFSQAKKLAEKACTEAFRDAGLQHFDPERIGCTVSASKPLYSSFRRKPESSGDVLDPGFRRGDEAWIPPNAINDYIVRRFGIGGECRNVIAACATGAYSIALAASWIEQGLCDIVLAGSVEPSPHPLIEAGFRQMGVISPEGVTRPFDRKRSGFAFGEGAGIVVLESEPSARTRGAKVYGRLSGWALGADSHSAVAFNSNGAKIAGVIEKALKRGRILPQDISHVNAHGTATRLNDWIETQALLKAFGPHASRLMISATKGSTGHLLGASGSVEFIFTVQALAQQFIPPTATLEEPDPECPLDYTARQGHSASFDHALSLSFGFGGPIGALVVSSC